MNKIYKVVWNASIGTWIVVSELAKSKTRTGSVSSSSEITGSQNEIVSKEKKFRPKALVLSIISCLAVSHVWADYTNLYGSIIDTSPTISNGIAIGANTGTPATANDSNGLAVGSRANASAADSTALGNYVNATGVNSTVVGGQASAAGAQSIALQNNSDADLVAEGLATGSSFTAVDSASSYSVAIGAMSQVVGSTAAMAIGKNAQVNSGANNATAIGNTATVDTNAVDGVAIGTNSLTSAANSVALGPRSTANVTNSVALGAGSTTTVQSGNSYITNVAASTTNGVVSVGSATNTRRIQNVADGAADSDAVTVAQLKDVNNRAVGNTTALGGGAAYNPATDVYTPPSYTITKTDGTTYTPVNTVSGALTNLNNEVVKPITFAGNTGSSANNLGTTLNITGGGSTAGTYSGNNLKTAVTGNTVNIQMADAPVFSGTVTAGNLTTGGSLNVTGASNLNGGANLNNQKITNLAAGTISSTSTDAVNGSQLNTTNQNVTTAQNTANTAVINAAAAQNTANTAVTNAAAAQATADKGLNFSVNGGTADNVKLGETVNFANGTNTTAVYDPATNTYKYSVNDNIVLTNAGSLTVGNSKVDNNGLTITGGPSVTTAGINAGNQKITNVAAGTISSTSTDAVNGSQLNTTNQNVTTAQNTANTAVTNAAAAQNTANTAVTNAAAAQATADKGLNFSVNGGTADNVKLGETVNFANGTNTTAVYDPATNTYKYNVNDNIALTNAGSLTVGNSKVDNSGLTITGGPSVTTAGINAGNQKITNVTAGTISATSTDAVNGSQLNTTNQNVTTAQNTANTAVTNAAAAQATADKGLNFSVNGGTADNVKLGEMVNFADGTNTTAVYDPATNTYKYNVNDNIALTNAGSLTVGNTKVDNSGLTITGGPSVTTAGINAGNQKITNVTAGTISATSTDAVNGSQLNTTNQNVTTAQNTANTAVTNAAAAQNTANTAVTNAAAAQATADKGLNFSVNGGTADNVKLGETVNFADGTNTTAVYDPATNTYKYNVNDNIALTNAGSLTVGNTKVDNSGLTITGGPSVTTAGINAGNQKITNVTAGTISATSTDAVNGSQLNTTNQNVTTAQNTANTAVTNAAAAQNTANTAVTNAAAAQATADKGLNFSVNGGTADNVKLGETVNFADGTNTTAVYDSATNTYKYNVNDNIALTNAGSLTVGNTKVDNSGLTITGGPSVTTAGINAGNQKITNVAAGTNATDAVNVSQLDALSTSSNNKTDVLGNSTANNLGGGASYDSTTGAVSSPTYTVNGNNVNNVGDAITALDKGWTLQSNGTNAAAVKAGDTVDIGTVAGETNLKVTKTGNTIQYGLNRDLNIDSVTAGDSKLDTNGLTIAGGPSVTKTGIDAAGNTISNVAAGTNATDAVNKGQLDALSTSSNNKTDALGNSTANNLGGGASYDSTTGAVSSPTYVTTKTDGTTVNANNVGDALTNLNNEVVKPITFAGNSGSVDRKLGETLNITGGLTASGSNSNVKTVISGNTVDIQLADAPVFAGKLTANGLDANGEKVTNVGAGTAATDAVNKGQLDALSTSSNNKTDALGNSTANNLGGGASYDSTTGAVSSPTYTVNGNNVNNVGDAITALDKGWTLQSNGTNAAAVKAGDTVDIGTVAGETNLKVTKTGNTIQYGLNRDLNIDSVTAGDSKLDTNGLTIAGGPSVTKTGIDAAGNTISNVAAGTNATDAVNKGQLDHVDNRVTQVTNTTASIFGGGAKANTDGSISNPTYNVAGTSANNVGDALTALDKAVTDAGTAANAGWTVSANGDAATAKKIKPNGKVNFTGDDNLTVAQSSETDNEGNIKVALNKNLKVDSVTTGNTVIDTTGVKVGDNVQLGSTGLIIAGGPSITTSGISAGNKTISNVAAGVSSTDAVNKGQLDSAISSINNNVGALANSAVQYDKNSDGSVNKDSITLAGGANGTTIKNVANGTVAEGSKDAVNGGQLWTVQQQVNKNTGDISNLQTDISNINNGKSGLVQQADKDAAITVGKDTGGTQVNVAGTAGERTVTGVKAGAVTESSKDAVNGSQLNTTNQALVNYLGGGAGYDNITQSFSNPTYNVGDQSYHNVGDAIGALNQADQTLNTKIDNVSNKLEQAFYATNQRIDDVEKRANAGIAAAMALENAPFVAGKYTYAVGAAYHGGENAVGVTLRKTADNGRWSLTGGVAAASQGDPSVRIGISGVID
ncbi:Autotransporter adhesin [Acinetobacter baumannii]|uniref:ESPR-type extended signal peptide-containing protein n=1 Tax=Acinetobacter baumannii TaxID=470 RepID=UPI000DE7B13C|nr:ESPR-type extended signal peptide-containing protein [Acinetobacter baumannii]SSQ40124.1 Autotransporter adhesin [Acinetobacter baumannii]